MAERTHPTLRPVITEKTVTLRVSFDDAIPEAVREAWTEALEKDIAESGLTVAEEDHLRTVVVEIHVALSAGEGSTDAGGEFQAARATAVIELGRSRIERRGRGFAKKTRAAAMAAAMDDLRDRVVDSIAF